MNILRMISQILIKPSSIMILIIVGMIFYRQNKKISIMQKLTIGDYLESPIELTISQIVIGIFGAIFVSLLMWTFNITFNEESMIELLLLISLVLMLIKPRFICFSYSGFVLGMCSIIFSKLSVVFENPNIDILKIDIVSLMLMIAIIHFVEGIMVMIDGKRGCVPVFGNQNNKVFGGFVLKRYWMLPITIFLTMNSEVSLQTDLISIISSLGKTVTLSVLAFYGIIGYNSITFTKTKQKKVVSSGISLIIYSLLLFIFADLSKIGIIPEIVTLIFAPVGHEIMIFYQRYYEIKNKHIYVSNEEGMRVLEVIPHSLAHKMGVKSGDLLININDMEIGSEKDIIEAIQNTPNYIYLKLRKITGELKEVRWNKVINANTLGILVVPKNIPSKEKVSKFKDILSQVKNKDKN